MAFTSGVKTVSDRRAAETVSGTAAAISDRGSDRKQRRRQRSASAAVPEAELELGGPRGGRGKLRR
jgi:hypothetical protein